MEGEAEMDRGSKKRRRRSWGRGSAELSSLYLFLRAYIYGLIFDGLIFDGPCPKAFL
jgi:hypothetical protein